MATYLGHKEVNPWGKSKYASFYPKNFLPWVKKYSFLGYKKNHICPKMAALFCRRPWSSVTPKLVYFYLKEACLFYSNKMYQIMYYVIVSKVLIKWGVILHIENLYYHLFIYLFLVQPFISLALILCILFILSFE